MSNLLKHDLRFVAQRLPRDIRDLLRIHAKRLFVGGGFVRACIASEIPSDIDLFGDNAEWLDTVATSLVSMRHNSKIHRTRNAITILTPDRLPVQFITRWTFNNARDLIDSFDFTVCQATIWRSGNQDNSAWRSYVGRLFYQDLAARRLTYTSPVREEEAGGSMMRVIKYVKRGYSIQVDSLGAVMHRCCDGTSNSQQITERLREVDPLLVIDGFEVIDDHEPIDGEASE